MNCVWCDKENADLRVLPVDPENCDEYPPKPFHRSCWDGLKLEYFNNQIPNEQQKDPPEEFLARLSDRTTDANDDSGLSLVKFDIENWNEYQ